MLKLLHISDLHFGKPFIPEVSEALLATVATLGPEVIVISGDLTQRAKAAEFQAARAFLDRLPPVPHVVVPGNHDVPLYRVWERLSQPHSLYQRYIAAELDKVLKLDGAVLVGLDSTDPYRAIKNGRVRSEQLALCARAFASVPPEAMRIVVLHHHLVPSPSYNRVTPMSKAKRALEVFTQLKVDLLLTGHLHRAYVGNSLDVYSGKDREHGIITVQCGTSTSRRGRGLEREKNTFNWIQISNNTVQVIHYMYFSDIKTFSPISRHEFARPNRRYLQEGLDAPKSA